LRVFDRSARWFAGKVRRALGRPTMNGRVNMADYEERGEREEHEREEHEREERGERGEHEREEHERE